MWARLGAPRRPAFEALEGADPEQAAPHLGREHPQTIAMILTQLRPQASAALLERLTADLQTDVAHRIATLDRVSPEFWSRWRRAWPIRWHPCWQANTRWGGQSCSRYPESHRLAPGEESYGAPG